MSNAALKAGNTAKSSGNPRQWTKHAAEMPIAKPSNAGFGGDIARMIDGPWCASVNIDDILYHKHNGRGFKSERCSILLTEACAAKALVPLPLWWNW